MFLSLSERFPQLKTQQNFPMACKVVVCLTSTCHPTWRPSYGCHASHVVVQNLYKNLLTNDGMLARRTNLTISCDENGSEKIVNG